jgi:hypothetical protein
MASNASGRPQKKRLQESQQLTERKEERLEKALNTAGILVATLLAAASRAISWLASPLTKW